MRHGQGSCESVHPQDPCQSAILPVVHLSRFGNQNDVHHLSSLTDNSLMLLNNMKTSYPAVLNHRPYSHAEYSQPNSN